MIIDYYHINIIRILPTQTIVSKEKIENKCERSMENFIVRAFKPTHQKQAPRKVQPTTIYSTFSQ